jgi:hypothetical protein
VVFVQPERKPETKSFDYEPAKERTEPELSAMVRRYTESVARLVNGMRDKKEVAGIKSMLGEIQKSHNKEGNGVDRMEIRLRESMRYLNNRGMIPLQWLIETSGWLSEEVKRMYPRWNY